MTTEPSKIVTPAQIKFLRLLHILGPMTVNELAGRMEKSVQYTHQITRELRDGGMITPTLEGIDIDTRRRLAWKFKLAVPIDEIDVRTRRTPSHRIPDTEILYAAILRNSGMTGQDLQNQFRTEYPHRTRGSIVNIITRARQRGLCR